MLAHTHTQQRSLKPKNNVTATSSLSKPHSKRPAFKAFILKQVGPGVNDKNNDNNDNDNNGGSAS